MRREFYFYFLVTGLSIQLSLITLLYFPILTTTRTPSELQDLFIFNLFLVIIFAPLGSVLTGIGNKGFRVGPTWFINAVMTVVALGALVLIKAS